MEENANRIIEEFQAKNEELNKELISLVQILETQVKELKEDTLLNAQHINVVKEKFEDGFNTNNSAIKKHIDNTAELVTELETINEANGTNNYENFLKNLLKDDYAALQNDAIENVKRELKNIKPTQTAKQLTSLINIILNVISIISFALIVFIIIKYQLLSFT